jgi:hypothetical protein
MQSPSTGRRRSGQIRRTDGRDRPGAGGGRLEGSLGLISVGVWSSGCAGGVAWQRRPVLAAVPPAPAVVAAGAKEWAARKASVGLEQVWSGWRPWRRAQEEGPAAAAMEDRRRTGSCTGRLGTREDWL